MMKHTNIIPVKMGCQITSDGMNILSPKISNQTAFAQIIPQIRGANRQEIENTTVQLTADPMLTPEKAIKFWLQHFTQNLKYP